MGEDNKMAKKYKEGVWNLQSLRPMDAPFLIGMFYDNPSLTEFALRILTDNQELAVASVKTQVLLKPKDGAKEICLAVYAEDTSGAVYDVEVRPAGDNTAPLRARYYADVLDYINGKLAMERGRNELPNTYLFFITENDYYKRGRAIYHFQMVEQTTKQIWDDGRYTAFVNGEYQGEEALGKLIHDFNCTDPDEMVYEQMAERARFLKTTETGQKLMADILERYED